jgi:hypothetical protein
MPRAGRRRRREARRSRRTQRSILRLETSYHSGFTTELTKDLTRKYPWRVI